jgi:hypothetical protein
MDSSELHPSSQYIFLNFILSSSRFFLICSFHRNLVSRVILRYFAVLAYGICMPLMKIGRSVILLFVKLICTDLDWCKMFSRAPRSTIIPGCRPPCNHSSTNPSINVFCHSLFHTFTYMFILEFVRTSIYSSVHTFTTVLFTYSFITIHVFIHASSDLSIRTFYV